MPTDAFVPLTAAKASSSATQDFRLLLAERPQNAVPFRSMTAETAKPAAGANHAHEPRILLQRDGDKVTGIHIECGCGEVIDLACVYEAGT